jgi:uncharacterized membrane protein YkvA (DUF1232 family)
MVSRLGRIAVRAGAFWTEAHILYRSARDGRVRWPVRLLAAAAAIYILSPIDIVPDPIPFVGIVDDFIIIPLGLLAMRLLIPDEIMAEHRAIAESTVRRRPVFGEAFSLIGDIGRKLTPGRGPS